ncbi:4-hydroxymandelate oxidase [Sphingobium sp. AP50]|uniref:alpha-hydroxy acid oxidase n=1 Tax=Sphingobium sp. AP50 TaxID=1884369 RepID=UPI0008D83018|nr:alpha-hydroxy acid oxidase [Sphingobium sp. AP50]SEJ23365.1 4-hydroxymandelate oxidase [Sphingobium sp. AP50]
MIDSDPLPPLTAIPADIRALADYERHAEGHIATATWAHIQSGAGAEQSLADNRTQFDRVFLMPRALRDLSEGSTRTTLFGHVHAAPILLAPIAYHRLVHVEGELATMGAATALDTSMIVSTLSSIKLEQIAEAAFAATQALGRAETPPLWFQLYFQPNRDHTLELVRRAEAAGYQILVVTIDAAIKRSEFTLPDGVDAANLRAMPTVRHASSATGGHIVFGTPLAQAAPTWADIDWLRSQTSLPIVIKGILSPDDAAMALDRGADGLIVSNHGGRVMDGLIPPMEALPAIAARINGRCPILLDSGVRTGTDALKAIALGASAVLVGRPQLHALAVAGVAGVAHMIHMLRAELELAMAQVGAASIADIDASFLVRRG